MNIFETKFINKSTLFLKGVNIFSPRQQFHAHSPFEFKSKQADMTKFFFSDENC